ncbi:MAG: ATP-binding protein [Pyrinomonadaceae bacterium]
MFDQLIGNARVKETLRRMLAAGRVPGALCFAGEAGIGKKLFALEVAKALCCGAPEGTAACGQCSSCIRIARIAYPAIDDTEANKKIIWSEYTDVGVVRPAGRFITVAQMREVERETNFRPYEGAARVLIIEQADQLNEASSNALLKTLEEPPPTSHIILLTARPAALLPTIRSRCQTIRFAPLTSQEIETHLSSRDKKSMAADAHLLARASQGSIGRALSLDAKTYRARRDEMFDILSALLAPQTDRASLLRAAEVWADAKHKDEYEPRLEALEMLLRDLWAVVLGAPDERLINDDLRARLVKLSGSVTSRRAARWLSQIEQLRGQLAVNVNRKIATDALFLAMARD